MASKKHPKVCAYCGKLSFQWTEDHVVPQCLWDDQPLPDHCPKVPACQICNNFWSKHEGYFRSVLALTEKRKHPIARKALISGAAHRHLLADSQFRNSVIDTTSYVPIFTKTGIFERTAKCFSADMDRLILVVKKIVRGMYFSELRQIVPEASQAYVWPGFDFWENETAQEALKWFPDVYENLGNDDDVFLMKRFSCQDGLDPRFYLFWFYGSIAFLAAVFPLRPNDVDRSRPSEVARAIAEKKPLNKIVTPLKVPIIRANKFG
jgi:hypothetical protein